MGKLGPHAVVIGASIGGLLAARVLADAYAKVTITDRDILPPDGRNRRGVPQGQHIHVLLSSGAAILEDLFPGLLADLINDGTPVVSDFSQMHASFGGHRMCERAVPVPGTFVQPTRPYLEWQVRARVRALPNVDIMDRCEVSGLVATDARDRVTGVRLVRHAAGDGGLDGTRSEETLRADLVVDATGRTGRTAAWLPALGYAEAAEEQVRVQIRYVSRPLRLRPDALGGKSRGFIFVGASPGSPRGMGLFAVEGERWMLTVFGYQGHQPPTDPTGSWPLPRPSRRPACSPRSATPSRSAGSSPISSRPVCGGATTGSAGFPPGSWSSAMRSAVSIPSTARACRSPRFRRWP